MKLGTYARSLLSHDHFNTISDEFEAQSAQQMLQTLPHEQQQREAIYAETRGKREFISLLLFYAQNADAILEKDGQKAHPDEQPEEIDY